MVIQHNLLAMNANRQFKINNVKAKKATEKLSSGYKINRAADDAAGLAISEKMRRQIRGLNQSAENIQEGIGFVQTADGALDEAQNILQRINELAVKSANGTNEEIDREYIDEEVQELKKELHKIFSTTSFNDIVIWEPRGDARKIVGWEKKQAVTVNGSGSSVSIKTTNANCDVLAVDDYLINADDTGIFISWTGYDGNPYETEKIDWDTFEKNNYTLEMSDYFGNPSDTVNDNLYDKDGNPVFKYELSLSVVETATRDDIIQCINGTKISAYEYAYYTAQFEDNISRNGVGIGGYSLEYPAAYVSNAKGQTKDSSTTIVSDKYGYDFDALDDVFLEPNIVNGKGNLEKYPQAATVQDAKSGSESSKRWVFSFMMDGIGPVTATSSSITYYSNDRDDDDEDLWWEWVRPNNSSPYKRLIGRNADGTLGGLMSTLTGNEGLLNKGNADQDGKGATDSGGYINISFNMVADQAFTYGNNKTSQSVGTFTIKVNVTENDTEESVLKKINDALKDETILDFYANSSSNKQNGSKPYAKTHKIDVPIYGGINQFHVQAGVEANQHINVKYDCLSLLELELVDTNVLTQKAAGEAIDSVKNALHEISTQRADFGAYQNRLEHAYNANKNAEENTQASESVIRDTDMAKAMVEHTNQNILQNAGQAMLAQANQNANNILSLLS